MVSTLEFNKSGFTGKGYDKAFSNKELVNYLSNLRGLNQEDTANKLMGQESIITDILGVDAIGVRGMEPDEFNAFQETLNATIEKYSSEIDFAASQIGNTLLLIAQDTNEYWGLVTRLNMCTLLTSMSDDMLKTANILDESGNINEIICVLLIIK